MLSSVSDITGGGEEGGKDESESRREIDGLCAGDEPVGDPDLWRFDPREAYTGYNQLFL